MKRYFLNLLIGLDQMLTVILGGWPDETLSSYAYRLEQKGRIFGRIFRPMIDGVFWLLISQVDHCKTSTARERSRAQVPPELRGSK